MTAAMFRLDPPALDDVVGALPPIELGELTARAELLTRVDRKYVVPLATATDLVAALGTDAAALTIDGDRGFEYSSLYYDTPTLDCYRLAAHRRRRRVKVRYRRYVATGGAFLEVKYAGRRGLTVKERQMDFTDAATHGAPAETTALSRHDAFLTVALDRSGAGVPARGLAPTLIVRYRRTTLFLPDSGSRVTLDTDLTWQRPGGLPVPLGAHAVVESKSAGGPSRADRLLWSTGHRPDRISKYCTGLALLAPALPANRWHPVLRSLHPTVRPNLGGLDSRNAS